MGKKSSKNLRKPLADLDPQRLPTSQTANAKPSSTLQPDGLAAKNRFGRQVVMTAAGMQQAAEIAANKRRLEELRQKRAQRSGPNTNKNSTVQSAAKKSHQNVNADDICPSDDDFAQSETEEQEQDEPPTKVPHKRKAIHIESEDEVGGQNRVLKEGLSLTMFGTGDDVELQVPPQREFEVSRISASLSYGSKRKHRGVATRQVVSSPGPLPQGTSNDIWDDPIETPVPQMSQRRPHVNVSNDEHEQRSVTSLHTAREESQDNSDEDSVSEDEDTSSHHSNGPAKQAIIRAQREYKVRICTLNAFPDDEEIELWARECWENACEREGIEEGFSTQTRRMMTKLSSSIRGHVKDRAVERIALYFGFQRSEAPDVVQRNKELAADLLEDDGFAYKDRINGTGLYETSIIDEIILAQWFRGKGCDGVVFGASFNPIPIPLLALVLTALEFGVSQWSSGICVKTKGFSEVEVSDTYRRHIEALQAWRNYNDVSGRAFAKRQQGLYRLGRITAGYPEDEDRTHKRPRYNVAKFAKAAHALADSRSDDDN